MAEITLYQFPASHYNEKARWALDLKRVPHERVSLLPGPHAPRVMRLTGKTETPVLVDGDQVIAGSASILEHLERRFPEPSLWPASEEESERALAVAAPFDVEVGPAVRTAKFYEVMSARYALSLFAADKSAAVRALYRASFPLVAQIMKRSMNLDAEHAERGRERTREALDFVAKEAGPDGYLVGDRFSIADLTCAALLTPAVDVSDVGGAPLAGTEAEAAWLARWTDHPGTAWVREIYRRHRLPTATA